MNVTTTSSTGHLAMFHTVTAELPMPTAEPTLLASGPVSTKRHQYQREQNDEDERDQHLQGAQLDERAALLAS